ncbi:MAG: hypothetical protein V7700_01840 [Halioglobus sp.]
MPVTPVNLNNQKILITGSTRQVALPVVERPAKIPDVYTLARFGKTQECRLIEGLSAKIIQADLADAASLQQLPEAFGSLCIDTQKMHELIGQARVDWRAGIRSQIEHLAADLLL